MHVYSSSHVVITSLCEDRTSCICMNVCMYVCMYACMYIYIYICTYACILFIPCCDRIALWRLNALYMYECVYVCMYVLVYVLMSGHLHTYTHITGRLGSMT